MLNCSSLSIYLRLQVYFHQSIPTFPPMSGLRGELRCQPGLLKTFDTSATKTPRNVNDIPSQIGFLTF